MNTKLIPSINTLVAKMPSGRDIYTIPKYTPPDLDRSVLESMRAMPEGDDEFGNDISSDDDLKSPPVHLAGAYPSDDLGRSSTAASSHTYF